MEHTFETSFIPKQPLLKSEGGMGRRESVSLALVLALVVFFVTAAVAVGAYFYKLEVDKRVLALAEELQNAEKNLSIDEIAIYKHINERMIMAKGLINEHNAFSAVLNFAEDGVADNVGLTGLSFVDNSQGDTVINLTAEAPGYGEVYFQAESWRKMKPLVRSVRVDMLQLSPETGVVTFGVTVVIDPTQITYPGLLEKEKKAADAAAIQESNLGTPLSDPSLRPISPTTP